MIIGEFSKTKVVMMYLDNLAEKDNVDFLEESLRALEYDQINDSAYLQELMGEKSIFLSISIQNVLIELQKH